MLFAYMNEDRFYAIHIIFLIALTPHVEAKSAQQSPNPKQESMHWHWPENTHSLLLSSSFFLWSFFTISLAFFLFPQQPFSNLHLFSDCGHLDWIGSLFSPILFLFSPTVSPCLLGLFQFFLPIFYFIKYMHANISFFFDLCFVFFLVNEQLT